MDQESVQLNKFFSELCRPEVLLLQANKHIESKVYASTEAGIAFVKIDFPTLGFYINSISIRDNPRNPECLWVQVPKFRTGSRWTAPLEFKSDSALREVLIKYSLKAYFIEYNYGTDQELLNFISDNFP